MAVVATLSNHWLYLKQIGAPNLLTDTLKVILMDDTFAFNKDAHALLADVTANQLATDHGYTQDTKELANKAVSEDDANDRSDMTCDDPTWTASAGAIGPTGAACVYDDTLADDPIIGCIDFGVDYTIPDGSSFQLQDIIDRLKHPA